MNTLGKFAVLGAVLVASAASAFATPFAGWMDIGDLPVSESYSGGTVTGTQNIGGDFSLLNVTKNITEPSSFGVGTFANFTNITLTTFTNLSSVLPGQVMYSASDGLGDTIEFVATGLISPIDENTADLDVNLLLYGYYTETAGTLGLTNTDGSDDLTFNASPSQNVGNLTEDFLVDTPEPASLILLGTGLFGASALFFRRQRREA